MGERGWWIPSLVLTVALGASALALMPDHAVVMPALMILPLWLSVSAALAAISGFVALIAGGVKDPIQHILRSIVNRWRDLVLLAGGITLAGLNMIAFMWTKPLLNHYVPFWADPYLARLDRALFLGRDPWTLLDWLNSMPMAIFYHRGWFGLMIVTLLLVLTRAPSPRKSALMLTYFLLWTIVGPVIHVLLPAAGPAFFERLGYGPDFAAIPLPTEMVEMTNYLWTYYSGNRFGPGSGISAMPSLHIATTAWMIIATRAFAPRWTYPMAAVGGLIFLLSMSLGWHYAVDGIVGGGAALLCYRLCLSGYEGRLRLPSFPTLKGRATVQP